MRTFMGIGLACVVMAALPVQAADGGLEAESSATSRHAAVWVEPLGTALLTIDGMFYLPLGASVPLSDRADLVVELSGLGHKGTQCQEESCTDYWGGYVAVGATFHTGSQRLSGFFFQPKLIFALFDESASPGPAAPMEHFPTHREYNVGLDIGYQWVLGPVYIAPVVGLWVGYGQNVQSVLFLDHLWHYPTAQRPSGFIGGMNVNLLRIGAVF